VGREARGRMKFRCRGGGVMGREMRLEGGLRGRLSLVLRRMRGARIWRGMGVGLGRGGRLALGGGFDEMAEGCGSRGF